MNTRIPKLALTAGVICLAVGQLAAQPPGKGGGKPGGGSKPAAAIAYLSDDNSTAALSQAAIRGTALSVDGLTGSDLSLLRSKAGRSYGSVAWSPDGTRLAWIETGLGMTSTAHSILVGAPGSKGTAVYTSTWGDGKPLLGTNPDSLAWGRDCTDAESSVLVFGSYAPFGIFAIRFVDGQPGEPVPLMILDTSTGSWVPHGAFAFSPSGQHLAFGGSGPDGSYGLWLLPMCTPDHTPRQLLSYGFVNGWEPIISADWSRWGDRLALSVIVGPEEDYPWRDIEIVDLNYVNPAENDGVEDVTFAGVRRIDLDERFTPESSEHSPQWGPSAKGAACQRIAFSQSSDIAPRSLHLLDVSDGSGVQCELDVPLNLAAKYPRALDWQ